MTELTINASIIIIELAAELPADDAATAQRMFGDLGLDPSSMFSQKFDDHWRYFIIYAAPRRITDCKALVVNGDVVAWTHGTDCELSWHIETDMVAGTCTPLTYCQRRLLGGAFKTVDIGP